MIADNAAQDRVRAVNTAQARVREVIKTAKYDGKPVIKALETYRDQAHRRGDYVATVVADAAIAHLMNED